MPTTLGNIVILNGAPRSGKSSIVAAMQEAFDGPWMNLGVDVFARLVTPPRYRPGIGLRPGAGRAEVEALVPAFYAALYDSVAAHARQGLNVVVDVGHHEAYSQRLSVLSDAARRLAGLPVLFVGVRCPLEVIMGRRDEGQQDRDGTYETSDRSGAVPDAVRRWQHDVHQGHLYDLEVDTSRLSPAECAQVIRQHLQHGAGPGSSFARMAAQP
jgi:chloramphenicol 3-O phosphotransferase